ncbi:MAG: polymer-forming cytoskeletal protein [Lachnospiraceae bacterium]|nr:polymer-forming cytoskeletal protein [Lachnospiraceae bacterium]
MFGKVDDATKDKLVTIISEDVVIDGSIVAKKAIRVDGIVNGAVHTKESVVVGAHAVIRGGIKASNVMTAGEVYGDIEAPKGKIEISDTGRVFGDLSATNLVIDENAVFQGKCVMNGKDAQPTKEAVEVPEDLDERAEKVQEEQEKDD